MTDALEVVGRLLKFYDRQNRGWIVGAQIDAGKLPTLDESPNLMAWFEREYQWPALYADEGGQG
jgi:hypothetical protein